MKNYLFLGLCLVGLSGCGASFVNKRGDSKSPYAPSNEAQTKGGTVKYVNDGSDGILKSRRNNAYKMMHKYCGGDYRILQEGERLDGGGSIPIGGVLYHSNTKYWYIDFECAQAKS